ncbi:MAG: SMI1/KNR4 family protein [Planctomycetota bacterium]
MADVQARFLEMLHKQVADLARRTGVTVPAPATEHELDEAREAYPSLPPSYIRLLTLQNGWPNSWEGFSLLSTNGLRGRSKPLNKLRRKWWKARKVNPDDEKACANWKSPDNDLVPWHHIVFGWSKSGELLVFDISSANDDGEMPVVRVHPQGGVICSWPALEEWMLAAASDGLEEEDDYTDDEDE